jgi:hypothetical protein
VTRKRVSTAILFLYKLSPKTKSLGNAEEIHSSGSDVRILLSSDCNHACP